MKVELFSQELVKGLDSAFHRRGLRRNNENIIMWESYYKLCSSNLFAHKWADHLSPTCGTRDPSPIFFYQFVTDVIFEELMKHHLPVLTREHECHVSMYNEKH